MLGALLMTAGGVGTFALTDSGPVAPGGNYLVANHDLRAGDPLTLTDVRFEPMTLSPELAARALNSTTGLEGAVLLVERRAGSLIDVEDLIASSQPTLSTSRVHEIRFAIPLDRTAPDLRPGDRVTVLATRDDITHVAAEDAPVTAFELSTDRIGSNGAGTLTLAIADARHVMTIAHFTQTAELTVVRSTRAVEDAYPDRITTPADEQ